MSILLFVLGMFGVNVPAADDGVCPSPQPAITAGDDYSHQMWTHADGTLFGLAPAEDSCIIVLVADAKGYPS